jgi:hypothetical protein
MSSIGTAESSAGLLMTNGMCASTAAQMPADENTSTTMRSGRSRATAAVTASNIEGHTPVRAGIILNAPRV